MKGLASLIQIALQRLYFFAKRMFSLRMASCSSRVNEAKPQYAILVDAENAQWSLLPNIIRELTEMGAHSSVRRIYGDFSKPNLLPWKQTSLEFSFRSVNAFSFTSGKGSSDAVMIIEAMDLLFHHSNLDGFVLVSSDSDFTPLAQRLREAGKHVIGFGQRQTPMPFVTACERFIYTERLRDAVNYQRSPHSAAESKNSSTKTKSLINKTTELSSLTKDATMKLKKVVGSPQPLTAQPKSSSAKKSTPTKTVKQDTLQLSAATLYALKKAFKDAGDKNEWVDLASLGQVLSVEVRNNMCRKLSMFFAQYSEYFELRKSNGTWYVRMVGDSE